MFVGGEMTTIDFCPSTNPFEVPYGHGRDSPASTPEVSPVAHQPLALGDGSVISDVSVSAQSQFGYMLHGFNGEPYGEGYLVVSRGEQVSVLGVEDQWTMVQCHGSHNACCWVPTAFVRRHSEQDV